MATGDQSDIFARLKSILPGWFGSTSPIVDALLQGYANAAAWVYSLYAYAKLQTRIRTATDGWLDMIAADYFGPAIQRQPGQTDASFRTVILANVLQQKATRQALYNALLNLTGRAPLIIEPMRPGDTGGYGVACGYGAGGSYGSVVIPFQCFVVAYRSLTGGIPYVAGYSNPPAGYATPSQADYASLQQVIGTTQDAAIYAAIENVRPAGTIVWTRISN